MQYQNVCQKVEQQLKFVLWIELSQRLSSNFDLSSVVLNRVWNNVGSNIEHNIWLEILEIRFKK